MGDGKRPSEVSKPSATCVHTSLSKRGEKERTGKRGWSHQDMTEVEASLGMRARVEPPPVQGYVRHLFA